MTQEQDALAEIRAAMKGSPCRVEFGFALSMSGSMQTAQVWRQYTSHANYSNKTQQKWAKAGPFLTTPEGTRSSLLALLAMLCEDNEKEGDVDIIRGWLTIDPDDIELLLDVFKEPELGGGKHVADLREDGWVLEHSLVCRRSGKMTDCPLIGLVRDVWEDDEDADLDVGRWRVWIDPVDPVSQNSGSRLRWEKA